MVCFGFSFRDFVCRRFVVGGNLLGFLLGYILMLRWYDVHDAVMYVLRLSRLGVLLFDGL